MLLMQLHTPWEEAHLPLLLSVVRSRMRQVLLHHLAPHGLTTQQFQVLAVLEAKPGICHKNLAGAIGMDKPTATRLLQTLQKKAWVQIQADPEHGRRLQITLTPEGAELVRSMAPLRVTFRKALEEGMDASERQQLRDLLHKVYLNLDRLEHLSMP